MITIHFVIVIIIIAFITSDCTYIQLSGTSLDITFKINYLFIIIIIILIIIILFKGNFHNVSCL